MTIPVFIESQNTLGWIGLSPSCFLYISLEVISMTGDTTQITVWGRYSFQKKQQRRNITKETVMAGPKDKHEIDETICKQRI